MTKLKEVYWHYYLQATESTEECFSGNLGTIWAAFKALYPEVGQLIEMIKEEDYKAVSKLLHRIESCCMIRGACKTIKNGQPHIPIFTLHDCIVTTEEYIEEVKEVLLPAVSDITGFRPTVKVKKWNNKVIVWRTMEIYSPFNETIRNLVEKISSENRKRA